MRHISRIALVAVTILGTLPLSAFTIAQPASHRALGPREESVIAALKEFERAILASDTIALKRIWTDDYRFINAQGGIVTRAQRLANIASGATNVFTAINQREITVRVYGDNAVTQQLFTLHGIYSGVETNTEVRGSFVWVWRGGRWQLAANEITPVLP